ncbi:MAG: CPBP family intramembrane glutamic endopeptidase [Bacilli bacterium]
MKYLKNLILSFKEIFLLFILQYAILTFCLFIFGMDKSIIIGSIFICIIEIIYVIFKYKGKKIKVEQYNLFPYILLGIGITTTYNMILFAMNLGNEVNTNINIVFNIICSGIVGPIFEETLFRYSFINYLKKFNNTKMSIIISSIVFAICHTGITTIIYAFIIGLVNSYLYIKKKNILVPIVIHMSANIFVNVLNIFNPYILIIGIFLIVLSVTIIREGKD